jgi:hypothetical protein
MPSLPIELYRPIVTSADRDTLRNIALTSRFLQLEAEQLLYREISIRYSNNIYLECTKLLNKPRIFDLVHTFCIIEPFLGTSVPETNAFFDVLGPLLSNLSNLIVFSFDIWSKMPQEGKCRNLFRRLHVSLAHTSLSLRP